MNKIKSPHKSWLFKLHLKKWAYAHEMKSLYSDRNVSKHKFMIAFYLHLVMYVYTMQCWSYWVTVSVLNTQLHCSANGNVKFKNRDVLNPIDYPLS